MVSRCSKTLTDTKKKLVGDADCRLDWVDLRIISILSSLLMGFFCFEVSGYWSAANSSPVSLSLSLSVVLP
jgi:hypothetical protein